MKTTTYLFLRFNVQDGEHEHQHKVLIETKATNIKFVIMRYLSTYWGEGEYDRHWKKWIFEYGGLMLDFVRYEILSKEDYEYLSKFLI